MAKVKINKDRCKGCYLCVVNCPNGLIKISTDMNSRGVKPVFFSGGLPAERRLSKRQAGKCTGCAMCTIMCPDCGITVYR